MHRSISRPLALIGRLSLRSLVTRVSMALVVGGMLLQATGRATAQGVMVPDAALPLTVAPSVGTTQFFALNADGTVRGASSDLSSTFALNWGG